MITIVTFYNGMTVATQTPLNRSWVRNCSFMSELELLCVTQMCSQGGPGK